MEFRKLFQDEKQLYDFQIKDKYEEHLKWRDGLCCSGNADFVSVNACDIEKKLSILL